MRRGSQPHNPRRNPIRDYQLAQGLLRHMTNNRLGEIVKLLMRAKAMGARLNGKSVLERELKAWIDAPPIQLTLAPEPFDDYTLQQWQLVCAARGGHIQAT